MENYRYQIVLKNSLSQDNLDVIDQLYQPILGITSTHIYFSLISEEKMMRKMPKSVFTEQELATVLNLDISSLENELKKLEGMSLIKTFVDEKTKTLTYYLQKPLDPADFFNNVLFNDVLQHKLGAERYEMVKVFYLGTDGFNNNNELVDRSANFEQAFKAEFESFKSHDVNAKDLVIDKDLIDFSSIYELMKANDMDQAALTDQVKTVILANMNQTIFSNDELLNIIKEAYDFDNYVINLDNLRVLIKELVVKKQDDSIDELTATKVKEMEEHDAVEYASLLEEHPCDRTIVNIINNLRKRIFGLKKPNDGVINCLLEFSYWKNNTKIVGNYLYKIADSIVEKGLDTTIKVMNYLKQVANYTKNKVKRVKTRITNTFSRVKEPISDYNPEQELKARAEAKDESLAWLREQANN